MLFVPLMLSMFYGQTKFKPVFADLNASIYYSLLTVINLEQDKAKTEILSDVQQVVVSPVYLLILRKVTLYCMMIHWKILKWRFKQIHYQFQWRDLPRNHLS